jgi:hypothetical protein
MQNHFVETDANTNYIHKQFPGFLDVHAAKAGNAIKWQWVC